MYLWSRVTVPHARIETDHHGPVPAESPALDALWHAWVEGRDLDARATLVEIHMPLATEIARVARTRPTRVVAGARPGPPPSLPDLEQQAALTLLECVERYDPARGPFEHYARFRIRRQLFSFVERAAGVSDRQGRRSRVARRAVDTIVQELGRAPTPAELEALGLRPTQIAQAVDDVSARNVDTSGPSTSGDDEWSDEYLDRVSAPHVDEYDFEEPEPAHGLDVDETAELVGAAIAALPVRHRVVLQMYYLEGQTLAAIGRVFGVSSSSTAQKIRDRAVVALQHEIRRRSSRRHLAAPPTPLTATG